jgi:hypothetical protein
MEAGIREALALVLPEESTVSEDDMIDFVSGTLSVQPVPLFLRLLSLPVEEPVFNSMQNQTTKSNDASMNCIRPLVSMCDLVGFYNTHWPRDVCSNRVTKVEAPGQVQLFAKRAYLNSSSQTTYSANFTCSLFSGLKI